MMMMRDHRTISIADQIFDQLEKDILTGVYKRGEALSEVKLSEELGVSRTPIREAIRRLEQENFVQEVNKRIVVIGISMEDMPDLYEIRLRIEGLAAERAATNISDEELKEMKEIIELQRYYIGRREENEGDYSDLIKDLDSQFHVLLYRSCGSRALMDTLIPLHKKTTKFRKASVRKQSRAKHSLEEHEAIYKALLARDAKAAGEATITHVINARDSIMINVTEVE